MFTCKNGPDHKHEHVEEAYRCYGLPVPARWATATVPVSGPVRPYSHPDPATPAQVRYVGILGGDSTRAAAMTKPECSTYIEALKKGTVKPVTTPSQPPSNAPRKVPVDLLKLVQPGRYAVRPDSTQPWTFLRISIGKGRDRYKDCIKVQTQHGPNLSNPKLIVWPSGSASVIGNAYAIEDSLLLVIVDQQGAARNYAKELGCCARCGIELTDPESRRVGVGPECIKYWPHMRALADEEEANS